MPYHPQILQGHHHEFKSSKTKSNRKPFEEEGFASIAMKCREHRGLAGLIYGSAPVLCKTFENHLPPRKKEKEDYKNPTNPLSFKIKNSQGVVEDVLVIRISGVISIFKLIFKHFIQNIADV